MDEMTAESSQVASVDRQMYVLVPQRYGWDEDREEYDPDGYESPIMCFESKVKAEAAQIAQTMGFLFSEDMEDGGDYFFRYFPASLRYFRSAFRYNTNVPEEQAVSNKISEAVNHGNMKEASDIATNFLSNLPDDRVMKILRDIGAVPYHVASVLFKND